mmetsp:Transcript_28775/g.34170  ORF Transcript_28775/g.34170 Transcript_28775/m.34170 type:complete len:140 (-) Transcript_28775:320-739(-)
MAGSDTEKSTPPGKIQETTTTTSQQFDLNTINPQASLKYGIVTAVNTTNSILAQLEQTNTTANSNIVSRIRPLGEQLRLGLRRSVQIYDARQYYGVPIVIGSAAAIAIVVGARRGKIPAVVMGGLAGGGSYVGVYGLPN